MRVLFIHQNCPGQYKHLSRLLALEKNNQVLFVTQPDKPNIPGVTKVEYKARREPSKSIHRYIRQFEAGVLNGQAVARAAYDLKSKGFVPDIVCAHPGWGEALYIKDVFPNSPLLNYCEFYYRPFGSDVGFDPEYPIGLDDLARVRTKNAVNLLSLEGCDRGVSPTRWQRDQFPKEFRQKITVVHDGVDTEVACPRPDATFELPDGLTLGRNHEVVTYVARNLEPYRGFPTFMRAVAELCRRRPQCHFLVVGGDGVSYGRGARDGLTYREQMLSEVTVDESRVHFLGKLPYNRFIEVLQVSSVHVYLTYPFVLSWSMLEAMAAGCLIVGSDTAPVAEVITDGKNGLLADFFSHVSVANRVEEVLDHKDRMENLRRRARQTVLERYKLSTCLERHLRVMESLCHVTKGKISRTRRRTARPRKSSVIRA